MNDKQIFWPRTGIMSLVSQSPYFVGRQIRRDNKCIARLNDGSHVMIAKSHLVEVMGKLNINPAKIHGDSSKPEHSVEESSEAVEKPGQRPVPSIRNVAALKLRVEGVDIMEWGKSLSMIAALSLTGAGLLVAFPADAKSPYERPVTIHGQRADPDAPTRKVSYRDLNLATLAGETTLNRRVGSAVRSVCAESVTTDDFYAERSCYSFAWGGARPQIIRAVMRARQIAATGTTSILPVSIILSVGPN